MLRQAAGMNFSIEMLFSTSDGGATWTKLPNPPLGEPARFVSRTDGWLAGGPRGNRLYVTHDGGRSWSRVQVAGQAEVRYSLPVFENERDGLVAVRDSSTATLYETHDGGESWSVRSAMAGPDSQRSAIAVAGSRLIGITAEANAIASDFVSETEGWVVTSDGYCQGYKTGCSQQDRVLATTDGGQTLHDITPGIVGPAAVADADVQPWSTIVGMCEGFDLCDPTTAGLATWFSNSPYRYVNVYIGGNNAACPQPGLSSSWVGTVTGQGWGLIPTWVGPQAPCTSCTGCGRFSSNATKAASQGTNQAKSAASKMASIGLSGTIVYCDMEEYSGSASCSTATKAFINAWVSELHTQGYSAGVYGSPTNANADWIALNNLPDDVWLALWNGVASVENLSPLPNSHWSNNQRIHQYRGGVNQTYSGVTYNIDQDYLDGAAAK